MLAGEFTTAGNKTGIVKTVTWNNAPQARSYQTKGIATSPYGTPRVTLSPKHQANITNDNVGTKTPKGKQLSPWEIFNQMLGAGAFGTISAVGGAIAGSASGLSGTQNNPVTQVYGFGSGATGAIASGASELGSGAEAIGSGISSLLDIGKYLPLILIGGGLLIVAMAVRK